MECSKCGRTNLIEDDFYRYTRGGLMSHCKRCHRRMVNERLKGNKTARKKAIEYQHRRYWSDPEKYKAESRERYRRKKAEKEAQG